eukprot:7449010-Pyramimonas_sp.AAC.2
MSQLSGKRVVCASGCINRRLCAPATTATSSSWPMTTAALNTVNMHIIHNAPYVRTRLMWRASVRNNCDILFACCLRVIVINNVAPRGTSSKVVTGYTTLRYYTAVPVYFIVTQTGTIIETIAHVTPPACFSPARTTLLGVSNVSFITVTATCTLDGLGWVGGAGGGYHTS